MNSFTENKRIAQELKGNYTFKSPYHKGNKRLPFTVHGTVSFNDEFPIEVTTVEYRGWTPNVLNTSYKAESIIEQIKSGKLKKEKP